MMDGTWRPWDDDDTVEDGEQDDLAALEFPVADADVSHVRNPEQDDDGEPPLFTVTNPPGTVTLT